MSDELKLIVTIIPEIVVFLGIGLFILFTKKVEVITIPGFNADDLDSSERNVFSKMFFLRTFLSSCILIFTLVVLEILMHTGLIVFDTCVKIILPVVFLVVIILVISLIFLGKKFNK